MKLPHTTKEKQMAGYTLYATQYCLPDGHKKTIDCPLPIETEGLYRDMVTAQCCFELEVLTTGEVSITISNGDEDIDCSVVSNGPEVPLALVKMLKRKSWKQNEKEEDKVESKRPC